MKRLLIYGGGGHAREVASYAESAGMLPLQMADDDFLKDGMMPRSQFDPNIYRVVVAVGDCRSREKMVADLPQGTVFASIIHPMAVIGPRTVIGPGAMIGPGVVVSCDVKIGSHVVLNPHTSIAHDCILDDYVFMASGARLSGNCTIGRRTWIGVNATVREKLCIGCDVTVGMGAVVARSFAEPGIYAGVPARLLTHRANSANS